jgi:hypothetical protein
MAIAGCFGPEPREGLRCSRDGDCPPGQDCYPLAGGSVCASAPPGDGGDGGDGALFGAPTAVSLLCNEVACPSPRDPALTDDLTQIAFTVSSVNAAGDQDVYLASRPTADDTWGPASPAGAIDSLYVEEGGWMTGSGLALFFSRDDQNVAGPPYADLWVSERLAVTDAFEASVPVPGVVNTSHGDERGAAWTADGTRLLFARALDVTPTDHDLYLAQDGGGQWDTVARLDALSTVGVDERSAALVEGARTLFATRGDQIVEARWTGEDIASAEVVAVHDELAVTGTEILSGVWASPDGREIWFGACAQGVCSIYRAVR